MFLEFNFSEIVLKNILKISIFLVAIYILIAVNFEVPRAIGSVVIPLTAGGGLGNQMFRYAAGYALAKKTGSKLYIIIREGKNHNRDIALSNFNIDKNNIVYKNKLNKKFFKSKKVSENNFFELYHKKNYQVLIIDDDFESEIFFKDVKNEILDIFIPNSKKYNIDDVVDEVSKSNSVCVHIRRGDMLTNMKMYLMPIDFQIKAIELASRIIKTPKFFIFSDSIGLTKKELAFNEDFTFVNKSVSEDFVIMSKCSHNIIANSTFSWWAAYINKSYNHLVIAPSPRYTEDFLNLVFTDVRRRDEKRKLYNNYAYPKDWIKLEY